MADRTNAKLFGKIFKVLAEKITPDSIDLARKIFELTVDYDFDPDQMGADQECIDLLIRNRGIHAFYPEEGEQDLWTVVANPQIENGHTKIANEILDALCRYRIPGEERQVVDCIIRKTYGWNKKKDEISLSQFVESTGLPKHRIVEAIKKLSGKNLIKITQHKTITNIGKTNGHTYEFNKNFEQWKVLPKKVTLPNLVKVVTKNGNTPGKVLPILDTTKDISKDKKDNISPELFELSRQFLETQKKHMPTLVEVNDGKVNAGALVLDQLIRIDKLDLEAVVKPALRWCIRSEFWAKQVRSLAGLRSKSKNGETKFRNLLAAMETENPKHATPDHYESGNYEELQ